MSISDLETRRLHKFLNELEDLRVAQRDLDTERQLTGSLDLLDRLGTPSTVAQAVIYADATEVAVDGMCNAGATAEARRLASESADLVYEVDGATRRARVRGPRSLVAFRSARVHAQAIELDGDPDDAMRRLMSLMVALDKHPELGESLTERVRLLRGVLSSAKRLGGSAARHFADQARRVGDSLVDVAAARDSAAAASYLHRAGCEIRARKGHRGPDEAIQLLEASLALRRDTPRDRSTRGMAIGEIRVLKGDTDAGAALLSHTVNGFERVLPRHHESAREQLIERGLYNAA